VYTWHVSRFGSLRSEHGLLAGDDILVRELRGCGIDSGGRIQLLLESGGGRDLRSLCGLDGVLGRRRGKLGLLSRNGLLGLVNLLARRSLATEKVLDLAAVVASVLLADVRDLFHLLRSDTLDLGSLGVDEFRSVVELLVNQLLVGRIDQGNNEGDSGTDDSKSPVRNKLDEVV
jgi:hypothetical protein